MSELGLETSAVEWVIEYPCVEPLLIELGIDYFCGGTSLECVCRQAHLDPHKVLSRLRRLVAVASDSPAQGGLKGMNRGAR
jgi:hypothetical protein